MSEIRKECIKKELGSLEDFNIFVFNEVDSTNNIAKQMAARGVGDKTLIIAESQTNGRGRLGRSFLSPDGGIYLSIVLRPEFSTEKILKITTGVAVAVRRVISQYCKDTAIKWVNDIYISQKKVCGILAESATDTDGKLAYVIIGIGINVFGKCNEFGKELESIVTTIEENSAINPDRNVIIAKVFREVLNIYSMLDQFEDVIDEYKKYSLILGKDVYTLNNGEKKMIRVVDIDVDGALIAKECESGKEIRISSGEVSIRFN